MKSHILLSLLSVSTVFAHSPSNSPWHRRKRHTKHFTRAVPSGWAPAGCVSDGDGRALTGYMYYSGDQLTPASCIAACDSRGFTFSGLENGNECFCGNSLENGQGIPKPASECNTKCSGSADEICGGSWRLSLFQKSESTSDPSLEWKKTHSCVADPAESRLMSWSNGLDDNTPARCQALCTEQGFKIAGVEYGRECWCGNEFAKTPQAAPESNCNVPCSGDSSKTCGGGYYMTIYERSGPPSDPEPEPEPEPEDPTTIPDGWVYSACMVDAPNRILTSQQPGGGLNTPASCIAACAKAGFSTAGVEAGNECFCSKSFAYSPTIAPESECNSPCAGDPKVNCGGHYRASVYVKLAPSSGVLGKLLPVKKSLEWWTTSYESDNAITLSDESLRAFKITSALSRNYGEFDGKQTMKAHYPQGSRNPGNKPQGGLSFYAPGPANFDLTKAKEATFGFSVYFPAGFNAVLGGKLFGLYGGNSDDESVSCSGGSRSSACFSARMMWREELAGEFYTYLPPYDDSRFSANSALCDLPNADCNPTYGISVGRGQFYFKPGQWYAVSQRVKLNTAGKADGELELFADGVSVIKVGGLILRDGALGRIRGVMYQTFFGGSQPQYETPIDQDVYFADLTCAITEYYTDA